MKITILHPLAILFVLIISQTASGQQLYNIDISFSGPDVNKKQIGVQIYQGFLVTPLKKDTSNSISATIELSAKYPIIEISYFSTKHTPSLKRYFLKNQKCKLAVHYDKDSDVINIEQTSGVTSFSDEGLREFEIFARNEIEQRDAYARAYNNDFTDVDSNVLNKFTNYAEAVWEKGAQFIRANPDRLYSAWLYMTEILRIPSYSKKALLDIYNTSLKPRYKNSFEEHLILTQLDPNRLAINQKAPLPNKTFKDLQGSVYSISSFGKKLVLINVWSTSCVPCIEEIPRLKDIYTKYKTSLEIISFSTDTNEQKLRNFIKTKDLNWINVFNQPELNFAFGSDIGIPQLFLLDNTGTIIYSRSASSDINLENLEKTLALYSEKQHSNQK